VNRSLPVNHSRAVALESIQASPILRSRRMERTVGMVETEVYSRLTEIFHDVFDDDSILVTPQLSAKDVDGWDSLTHIRLIITIEKAFKIKFSTAEMGKLENVGDLVKLIEQKA
jgi:acyl carrier protein